VRNGGEEGKKEERKGKETCVRGKREIKEKKGKERKEEKEKNEG
jgi:hypothetical protein